MIDAGDGRNSGRTAWAPVRVGLVLGVLCLGVSAFPAEAGDEAGDRTRAAGPWTHAHLLYTHSEPAVTGQRIDRVARSEANLAIGTSIGDGTTAFAWDGERWAKQWAEPGLKASELAWVDVNRLLVVAEDRVVLVDTERSRQATVLDQGAGDGAAHRIPGTDQALLVLDGEGWLINLTRQGGEQLEDAGLQAGYTEMAFDPEHGRVLIFNNRQLGWWNHDEQRVEPWRTSDGETLTFGEDAALTVYPEARLLLAATRGEGLWAIHLDNGTVHRATTDNLDGLGTDLIYRRVGVDTKRDTLYVPTWREHLVVEPASDPEQWEVVGHIAPVLEPYVYSRKRAAPAGEGVIYLPQSDELLVGGRWGATVLGVEPQSRLVADERFEQFDLQAEAIEGQGRLYDRMRQEKKRSIWTRNVSEAAIESYQKMHLNTIFKQVFYYGHDELWSGSALGERLDERIRETAAMAEEADMAFVVSARPVGTTSMNHSGIADYDYRPWVLANGEVAHYTEPRETPTGELERLEFPCPVDAGYWERSLGPLMDMVAERALEYPSIKGFQLELGDGYSPSNFNPRADMCYCDECWTRFLDREDVASDEARQTPAEDGQRRSYLREYGLGEAYEDSQALGLAEIASEYVARAREIDPELAMLLALPETSTEYDESWWYRGWLRGFGSPDMPVVASSQQDYGAPYNPHLGALLERRLNEAGKHVIMVHGLALMWYPPEQAARLMHEKVRRYTGVFVYNMRGDQWSGEDLQTPQFRPLIGNGRQYTRQQYIDAFQDMQLQVDP